VTRFIPLNFELLMNPVNWVIVTLMVVIAGLAIGLIYHPNNDGAVQ